MSTGLYSTSRPADISPDDCEIWVSYQPSRDNIGTTSLTKLDPNKVLLKVENPNNPNPSVSEIFGGLYTLKLASTDFGQKGIYTIVIKPVEIRTKIVDCGVLSAFPDIKGLIFDTNSVPSNFVNRFENNGLVGYRIEYLNPDTSAIQRKIQNFFKIITSNNKAEPVSQNLTNSNQKAIRYRFNDNSTLVFATVSPSSSSNVKPNALPFIGSPNQDIIITNTFFNPMVIEIEMVENDADTLALGLFGNMSRSIEDGIITYYNTNNDIYKQSNTYEIKDSFTGAPLFEIKEARTSIDFTKQFNDITAI